MFRGKEVQTRRSKKRKEDDYDSLEQAKQYLTIIWGFYTLSEDAWCEIRIIRPDGKAKSYWFKWKLGVEGEAVEWLKKNWNRLRLDSANVYLGVLPRTKFSREELNKKGIPKKGGKARNVEGGLFIFTDLDYKQEVDPNSLSDEIKLALERQGYYLVKETEDGGLEGYFKKCSRDKCKIEYVNKPGFNEFLKEIKSKLQAIGVEDASIIVDSGYGYHVYVKLQYEVDVGKWRRLQKMFIDYTGGDQQTKDPSRILRLPGTLNNRYHPCYARQCKLIYTSACEVDPDQLERKLEEVTKHRLSRGASSTATTSTARASSKSRTISSRLRLLKDSEILKVKGLLKPVYRPGQRQLLCLYLAGWGAHSRIHPISIAQIIKMLHEETGDEDRLEERLSVIPYSYKKVQLWVEGIEKELLTYLSPIGVEKIYGLSTELSEEEVKGRGGIHELLVQHFGGNEEAEARANEVLRQLSEVFNHGRFDLVCELVDYEKQYYVCANQRRKIIARMKRKEDRLILKEKVFPIVFDKVVMYVDPITNDRRFELEIVGDERILPKPAKIGPAEPPDLVSWLRARGLCYHTRLAEDALNAILNAYLKRGIAEIKEEVDKPGFYLVDGKLLAVKFQIGEVTKEELREALELLNELAEKWYNHIIEKFVTVIKWGIVAPFSFIYKQKGVLFPWLYLYGPSHTGKTTLGELVLSIWNLGTEYIKGGSNIDTVARLGHVLSLGTFPVLINEPGAAILREDIVDTMKSATELTIARGRYTKGVYTEILSLAPIVLTSNKVLPQDDALLRRFIVVNFTFGERIDLARAKEFKKKVKPRLSKLKVIGYYVAKRVTENPELLDNDWLELAEKILEDAYREAELHVPTWIELRMKHDPTVIYEDTKEIIRNFLVKRINEEYSRFVGRVQVVEYVQIDDNDEQYRFLDRHTIPFDERVKIVLGSNLIPWMILKGSEVIITYGIVEELRRIIGDVGGLKSIAELFGWSYHPKKSFRIGKKVKSVACISVSLEELIEFLQPGEAA